jgi:hypothetical protein
VGNDATKSKQSLAHKSSTVVYDLSTVPQPEVRGEISPRIKCSSLRFKCNSLLYLNRGLPGSAVYDLSTVRHLSHFVEQTFPSRYQHYVDPGRRDLPRKFLAYFQTRHP